jgi:hypothetical protein
MKMVFQNIAELVIAGNKMSHLLNQTFFIVIKSFMNSEQQISLDNIFEDSPKLDAQEESPAQISHFNGHLVTSKM